MNKYTDKREWTDMYREVVIGALMGGVLGAMTLSLLFEKLFKGFEDYFCASFIISWLIAAIAIYNLSGQQRYAIRKFFLTDKNTTQQFIIAILENKGIPYQQTNKGFQLDTVEIRVSNGTMGKNGPKGISIMLGPYRGHDSILIDQIKQKIDDAFSPRGI
ncbi:MAG: hypothetical protein H6662_15265 [Ardenticatenaceae bacterium]|nr:hypothetical protein [Ardenticatenaceae bacterium]MCB8990320.1 hypothetical protein [Ardenticatenaceae bacterium]